MSEKQLTEITWEGTSSATIKRIMNEGVTTVDQLLTFTPIELADKIGSEVSTVEKVIRQAMKEYGLIFKTGTEVSEEQADRLHISTGSKNLDRLLKGGVEGNVLTEFIAEFHGGKTQLCKTLGVIAVNLSPNTTNLPPDKQGRKPSVVYIDCENTFNAGRVEEIAEARGYNPTDTLSRFMVATAWSSYQQAMLIKALDLVLTDNYIVLVIVDGMLSHLRNEYIGREMLGPRQGSLGAMLGRLLSIADSYKIPVVVTNQVQGNVTGYGPKFIPAGGHVMAHACTHRVMIKTKSKNAREIQVIDSPNISDMEKVRIAITTAGITDEDGSFDEAMEDEADG